MHFLIMRAGLILEIGSYYKDIPHGAYKINNYKDYIPEVSTYRIEDDKTITFINDHEKYKKYILMVNRKKRDTIFPAFDLWEKAVLRGREEDSPEIMQWYQDILDLKEDAFKEENIPERIKYYMGGN